MKITKVYPDEYHITIDTDTRRLVIDELNTETGRSVHTEVLADVLEDVWFVDPKLEQVNESLNAIIKKYGVGTVVNECKRGQTANRITAYDISKIRIFGKDVTRAYKVSVSDGSILDEINTSFATDWHELHYAANKKKSTEEERAAAALTCASASIGYTANTGGLPVTAGRLCDMLNTICSQRLGAVDIPIYVDDGTKVQELHGEAHTYEAPCGSVRGILLFTKNNET